MLYSTVAFRSGAVGRLYNNLVGESLEMHGLVGDGKAEFALIIRCPGVEIARVDVGDLARRHGHCVHGQFVNVNVFAECPRLRRDRDDAALGQGFEEIEKVHADIDHGAAAGPWLWTASTCNRWSRIGKTLRR